MVVADLSHGRGLQDHYLYHVQKAAKAPALLPCPNHGICAKLARHKRGIGGAWAEAPRKKILVSTTKL